MIDPAKVCLYIPSELKKFKLDLFNRIGDKIKAAGGYTIRGDWSALDQLPDDVYPIIGAAPYMRTMVEGWWARGRKWIYWDRGYARRVFATWLPRGDSGGYYRWHVGSFQLRAIRNVTPDRWAALRVDVSPWQRNGRHIVIAAPSKTYCKFHRCESWIAETIDALARVTDRQLVIRDKESKRDLRADLSGAHCLVTHGSIAAVESVVLGCPVFVHPDSAASLVGQNDLSKIEKPVYPDREPWLWSLAHSQWNETELTDGTLWRGLV